MAIFRLSMSNRFRHAASLSAVLEVRPQSRDLSEPCWQDDPWAEGQVGRAAESAEGKASSSGPEDRQKAGGSEECVHWPNAAGQPTLAVDQVLWVPLLP